jgi:hypothetical protein
MAKGAWMIKVTITGLLALTLAGCGAQDQPAAPAAPEDYAQNGAIANVGLGLGPNGVTPGVTLAEGIGRVTLGPGGVRLGPLGLGL